MKTQYFIFIGILLLFSEWTPSVAAMDDMDYLRMQVTGEIITGPSLSIEELERMESSEELEFNVNISIQSDEPDNRELRAAVLVCNHTKKKVNIPLDVFLLDDNYEFKNLASGKNEPRLADERGLHPAPEKKQRALVIQPGEKEEITLPIDLWFVLWSWQNFGPTDHRFTPGSYELRHKLFPTFRRQFAISAGGEITIKHHLNPKLDRSSIGGGPQATADPRPAITPGPTEQ